MAEHASHTDNMFTTQPAVAAPTTTTPYSSSFRPLRPHPESPQAIAEAMCLDTTRGLPAAYLQDQRPMGQGNSRTFSCRFLGPKFRLPHPAKEGEQFCRACKHKVDKMILEIGKAVEQARANPDLRANGGRKIVKQRLRGQNGVGGEAGSSILQPATPAVETGDHYNGVENRFGDGGVNTEAPVYSQSDQLAVQEPGEVASPAFPLFGPSHYAITMATPTPTASLPPKPNITASLTLHSTSATLAHDEASLPIAAPQPSIPLTDPSNIVDNATWTEARIQVGDFFFEQLRRGFDEISAARAAQAHFLNIGPHEEDEDVRFAAYFATVFLVYAKEEAQAARLEAAESVLLDGCEW